jgi:hypothetical protein
VSSESIELPEGQPRIPVRRSIRWAVTSGIGVIRAKHDEASIEREPAHRRSHGLL